VEGRPGSGRAWIGPRERTQQQGGSFTTSRPRMSTRSEVHIEEAPSMEDDVRCTYKGFLAGGRPGWPAHGSREHSR
jgi:hypothetical protein